MSELDDGGSGGVAPSGGTTDAWRSGFVERMAGELAAQGFPRMPANVVMALTSSDDGRLTATELADHLGVSAGAISGAVRYLSTLGIVRSSLVPGTRRHIYALPDDSRPWYTVTLARRGLYSHIADLLRTEVDSFPIGQARDRVADMADFFAFIDERMPRLLVEWNSVRESRRTHG